MVSNWLQKTIRSLSPAQCHLCRLPLAATDQHYFCQACLMQFPVIPRCKRCGLVTTKPVEQCGRCLKKPPIWHSLSCIGDYHYPLSQLTHQFKYQRAFWLAPPLSQLLTQHIVEPAPVITAVPLHWRRYLWRGFNQSDLLARQLSQQMNCEYWPFLFHRTRATPHQQGLSRHQRLTNLKGAFYLHSLPYPVEHVAIVDDVVTTGSTVKQLCRLLLDVGVQRVDIYCLCRTPEPTDS